MNWEGYEVEGQMDISEFLDKGESMTENEAIKVMESYSEEEYGKGLVAESHKIAIQALSEIQQYRAIGLTPELIEAMQGYNVALINDLGEYQAIGTVEELKEIRAKAIDEFAEALKERLKGMQMVELQGEDVCPCAETGGCLYMNCDVGCQYCAREQTIKDIDEIAEQMKAGGIDD